MTIAAQKPPEYASITTLARIRDAKPCREGWEKLLAYLGKTAADDEPLSLLTVLESNGLDDALWVLSFAMPDDRLARHFQAWCAEQVLPLFEAERPNDFRVRDQIAMLRNDEATAKERADARADAWAARDAAWAARAATRTAWDAARTARAAAEDAAEDAAWTARVAAEGAARAAWAAAGAAAGAARDAAEDARDAQEAQLRKMLSE